MQLVMVGNQHQISYGKKPMKAQNTINLGQISGKMKTWNTFILGSKAFDTIDHDILLKACAQRFRYALFAFIHTQTYFEYYTLTLRLASLVKKAVIYAYWTKELFDICRENVSYMATLPSVARHVIHADDLRPRH